MKKKHFLLIIILIFAMGAVTCLLLFTDKGSTFIIKTVLAAYLQPKSIGIRQSQGNFAKGKALHDIEIISPKFLPEESIIRIQKIDFSFASLSLKGLILSIHNGRMAVPGCELIPFQGNLRNNILNFNIYSKSVNIGAIGDLFPDNKDFKKISGTISGIDIFVKGSLLEPELEGKCKIRELLSGGFSLSDCPLAFNLRLKTIKDNVELFGEVYATAGEALGPKTAMIKLKESKILFSGDPLKAIFNIRGTSVVEGTTIEIALKGSLDQPELMLTSQPPLSKERLLLMLATGKSWKASELALNKAELTADSVKDFIDYFVFSGSGSKIARQLGISDFSVTFEKQKKGLGLKTSLTDRIDATYAVEQTQQQEGETPVTTQRLGGEYKITDSLTVGAEKELKPEQTANATEGTAPPNDKVFLKFKKEF